MSGVVMRWPWNKTMDRYGHLRGIGRELGNTLRAPSGWVAPKYLDLRAYCLPKNDQGNTSQCAAYSMAGLVEVHNWKRSHIPEQVDPAPLYAEAKRIDGDSDDGTTLTSVFVGAKTLGLIPKESVAVYFKTFEDYTFALHKYGPCLLGFRIDSGWSHANRDGWIPAGDRQRGGHAVLGCWYDLARGCGFQNSWGDWGSDGFGRITRDQFDRQIMGGLAVEFPS